MFHRKTLFIIGAGASRELGLPIGAKLAELIQEKMDIRFEAGYRPVGSGDLDLYNNITQERRVEGRELQHAAWLIDSEGSQRSKHRAALLLRAIQQAKSSSIVIPAPAVTAMWLRIYEIARTEYPLLGMKAPSDKGGNSWWLIFKGNLPPNVTVDWKVNKGFIDLSFWNGAQRKPTAISAAPADASFVARGSTVMFRAHVSEPSQNWAELTDEQIRQSLKVADGFLRFYNTNAQSFESTAAGSA
jgi:hypothetical protein